MTRLTPRRAVRLSLLCWAALPLFGCGGVLQAEDSPIATALREARRLYDARSYAAARDKAAEVIAKAPDNGKARYLRGLAEAALNDYAHAREDLEAARRTDPLLTFAKDQAEFNRALQTARGQTMEALADPKLAVPPNDQPADLAKPGQSRPALRRPSPAALKDPVVRAIAGPGPVVEDLSGKRLFPPTELSRLKRSMQSLKYKGFTLKIVAVPAKPEPQQEAKRLFEVAALDDTTLLIVAMPGAKLGAYTPTLPPNALAAELKAAAKAPGVTLTKRVELAMAGFSRRLSLPPPLPPPPAPAAPAAPVTPVAPPPPPPPSQTPWPYAAGGVVVVLVLWRVAALLAAKKRLTTGFRAAEPQLSVLADRLTVTCRALQRKTSRAARSGFDAAELAFREARGMMASAAEGETRDIGRVERAVRLLREAGTRLDEADAALAEAPERDGAGLYCYFTARPIADRHEGELVMLKHGGEERRVLACAAVGEVLRRGGRPNVRIVDGRHWAAVDGFDPAYGLFHGDAETAELAELAEPFFDARSAVFVGGDERPDYTLEW
ncbi:MAG: hypothetical protein HYU66_20515 [Armatimonadetes bacterium]|nr:hypothetical protein [Armatimonadota bacterium]